MFIGKLALAIVAGAIPVAVAVTPSWLKESAPPVEETNLTAKDPYGDCYAIETEGDQSQKLLICDNPDSLDFNDEVYYLYNTSDKSIKKAKSVIEKHKSNEIVIELAQEVTDSQGSIKVTLKVNSRDWAGFSRDINLLNKDAIGTPPRDCTVTPIVSLSYSSTTLNCNTSNPWLSKNIKITPFKVMAD